MFDDDKYHASIIYYTGHGEGGDGEKNTGNWKIFREILQPQVQSANATEIEQIER